VGKAVTTFIGTGTQGGGQETTHLTCERPRLRRQKSLLQSCQAEPAAAIHACSLLLHTKTYQPWSMQLMTPVLPLPKSPIMPYKTLSYQCHGDAPVWGLTVCLPG